MCITEIFCKSRKLCILIVIYPDSDIKILNACTVEQMCKDRVARVEKHLADIDISNAYTKSFTSIERILLF